MFQNVPKGDAIFMKVLSDFILFFLFVSKQVFTCIYKFIHFFPKTKID